MSKNYPLINESGSKASFDPGYLWSSCAM